MNIIERYNYPRFDSIDNAETGKRVYACPDGSFLPSVTTILSATKDMTGLNEWRKFKGDVEADRIVDEACRVGTLMHSQVEMHLKGEERPTKGNLIHRLARKMADRIITRGLTRVDEVWGIEVPLYFPHAYAGRSDIVGVFDGEPAIMDHKSSKKIKERKWLDDYFKQGCAYALAHNEAYDTKIRQIVLFMAGREDDGYETFVISGNEFDHYTEEWIKCLETFMAQQED